MLRFYDFYIDQQELLIRRAKYRGLKFIFLYFLIFFGFCTVVAFSYGLREVPLTPDQALKIEGVIHDVFNMGKPGLCGHSMNVVLHDGQEIKFFFRSHGSVFGKLKGKDVVITAEPYKKPFGCFGGNTYFVLGIENDGIPIIEYTWGRYERRVDFQDKSLFVLFFSSLFVLILMMIIFALDCREKDY